MNRSPASRSCCEGTTSTWANDIVTTWTTSRPATSHATVDETDPDRNQRASSRPSAPATAA